MSMVWGTAALLGLVLALPAGAAGPDDDLSVVKRAMKQEAPGDKGGRQAAPDETAARERPALRRSGKAKWLRVRIVEKAGRKKVNVNLPLVLVRALGDDFDLGGVVCGRHRRDDFCPPLRLAEVLAALDSGEDLVQVEDEDATVRVWVE